MIELTGGEELALADESGVPLQRVRFGIGWDRERNAGLAGSGKPQVDLDATAIQFADGQLFDLAFYNNLTTRDGSVVHLGDNTTGSGEGDDEQLTVDLTKVHGPVDRIVLLVSSYQGHSLQWVAHAYCRVSDGSAADGDTDDGDTDDADTELARFTLTLGIADTGLVMAVLVRDPGEGGGWRMRAIGEGVAITVPTQGLQKLRPFL